MQKADKTVPLRHRLPVSLKTAHRRVNRARRNAAPPVWTRAMTAVAAVTLLAIAALLPWDGLASQYVKDHPSRLFEWAAAVTNIGKSDRYLYPALALFLVSAFADWSVYGRRGRKRLARVFGHSAFLFGAVALSGIAVNIVKSLVGRARPKLMYEAGALHFEPFSAGYDMTSMPSGHACTMGAVTLVAMIWFPRLRWLLLPLGMAAAATRVAARAHYPADVLAGFVFGFLFALAFGRWLARRHVVLGLGGGAFFPQAR